MAGTLQPKPSANPSLLLRPEGRFGNQTVPSGQRLLLPDPIRFRGNLRSDPERPAARSDLSGYRAVLQNDDAGGPPSRASAVHDLVAPGDFRAAHHRLFPV